MAWRADTRAPRILKVAFERLADLAKEPEDDKITAAVMNVPATVDNDEHLPNPKPVCRKIASSRAVFVAERRPCLGLNGLYAVQVASPKCQRKQRLSWMPHVVSVSATLWS